MAIEIKQLLEAFSEVIKLVHLRSYQNLDQLKLYPGQPKFLALIKSNEGLTQKELSEKHFVKPSTITGMLVKLEANNYVYRVPDDTDKRIMRVYLTEEGRSLAEQSEKYMFELTQTLFSGFTDDEICSFLKLTDKMKKNLQPQSVQTECGQE